MKFENEWNVLAALIILARRLSTSLAQGGASMQKRRRQRLPV